LNNSNRKWPKSGGNKSTHFIISQLKRLCLSFSGFIGHYRNQRYRNLCKLLPSIVIKPYLSYPMRVYPDKKSGLKLYKLIWKNYKKIKFEKKRSQPGFAGFRIDLSSRFGFNNYVLNPWELTRLRRRVNGYRVNPEKLKKNIWSFNISCEKIKKQYMWI
jgi:hypothetical protein